MGTCQSSHWAAAVPLQNGAVIESAAADGHGGPSGVAGEKWLDRTTAVRLIQAAIAATGKPWLGLDLGWHAPISAHGEVAYAAVTAPDLAAALAVMVRFGSLRDDMFTWTLLRNPQNTVLQAVQRTDWGPANGFVLDTVVAAFMRIIEAALGQWPVGVRLELPVARPHWAAQYARVSPLEILFGGPARSFSFESAALTLPCMGGDVHAHANARRDCEQALAKSVQGARLGSGFILVGCSPGSHLAYMAA